MGKASNYKTKQKEAILSYIRSLNGQHVTVNQIADHFAGQDAPVGVTTIYRYLERLVEEGCVKKYMLDGTLGACFQYVGAGDNCHEHFHLKCEECGRLIHLECEALDKLQAHLLDGHGFAINSLKTVFYGKCKDCMANINAGKPEKDRKAEETVKN